MLVRPAAIGNRMDAARDVGKWRIMDCLSVSETVRIALARFIAKGMMRLYQARKERL